MSDSKKNENNAPVDTGAEAEKILAEAQEKAAKLMADAEKQAKKTTSAAEKEAEGIVAAAEEQAKTRISSFAVDAEKAAEAVGFRPVGAPDPAGEELVEYTLPLLGPEKGQDLVVGVNGKIIRIKRGETVKIQRKYVEVLQHAQQQEVAAYQAMEDARRQSGAAAMNL